MKQQSSNNMDGESRDLLLFNYLEGNLTEARARELEAALAADPALQAELEEWKASFVVQEFYSTEALEEQLFLKSGKGFSWSGPAAGFVVVLVASLFSFIPVGEQQEKLLYPELTAMQHTPPTEEAFTEPVLKEEEVVAPKVLNKPVAEKEAPTAALEDVLLLPDTVPVAIQLVELPVAPEVLEETPAVTERNEPPAQQVEGHVQQKKQQPKQISRKQQRQVRKMKEKALQQRKANEFIKGDRPYVVPLDTDNF